MAPFPLWLRAFAVCRLGVLREPAVRPFEALRELELRSLDALRPLDAFARVLPWLRDVPWLRDADERLLAPLLRDALERLLPLLDPLALWLRVLPRLAA